MRRRGFSRAATAGGVVVAGGLAAPRLSPSAAFKVARRATSDLLEKGGWKVFHTWPAGVECVKLAVQLASCTTGDHARFGRSDSEVVQGKVDERFAASNQEADKAAVHETNAASTDCVTFVPTDFFKSYQARGKNVSGMVKAPFPIISDVSKV